MGDVGMCWLQMAQEGEGARLLLAQGLPARLGPLARWLQEVDGGGTSPS